MQHTKTIKYGVKMDEMKSKKYYYLMSYFNLFIFFTVLVKMIIKRSQDKPIILMMIKKCQQNYGFPPIHRQVAPIFAHILLT